MSRSKSGNLSGQVASWALYDFANSGFATTILSVIFNVYFVNVICAQGVPVMGFVIPGESFWGYTISFSMLVVFLTAPVLGAVADISGSKKKFLAFFCILGCLFTGLLSLFAEGDYWVAALFLGLACIGFSSGNVFYNAFLKELSKPETVGRVSGYGWALGYLGGGLLLGLNLFMIEHPEWFGLRPENHIPVRASVLSVSVWWGIFSVPLFLWVREPPSLKPLRPGFKLLTDGIRRVLSTFREIRKHREVFKFLAAYLVYNDGIETIIIMAAVFGAKELGLSQTNLILCFLMIQGVAFLGSLLFGQISDRISHKGSIQLTLWIYIAVCFWGMTIKTQIEFWILGAVVGLILGGSQSSSRSLLALLNPTEQNTEFFGFFALTGKLSTVIGPFVFALLSQIYSLRTAVGGLSVFFALGLVILYFVKEPERRFV